jgi:mRNA interferase MazF
MNTPHRGEVWYISEGKTGATGSEMWANRFAVIVTNDVLNSTANFVNVVYFTSRCKTQAPTHVRTQVDKKNAIALCEQIFTVSKERLGYKVYTLDEETMRKIDKAMLFTLSISNTIRPTTMFNKWLSAIEKYGIHMDYNPNDDAQSADTISFETKEMYKNLYECEKNAKDAIEQQLQNTLKLVEELQNRITAQMNNTANQPIHN